MMKNKIILKEEENPTSKRKTFSGFFKTVIPMMVLALFMWQCQKDDFTGETTSTCPEVIATDPTNGETNVVINKRITVTFNKSMNASTINEATFLLHQGANPILGTVTYTDNTATFVPASFLAANTVYTGTITTGAKDPEGNALIANYVWSFTTGAIASIDQPIVIATAPTNGETAVALNRILTAEFNKAMNPSTLTASTFTLTKAGVPVTGTVSYNGMTATFIPTANFTASTVYIATITTGAKDLSGNALASNYSWTFTTGSATDTNLPTVISTDPVNGASNVSLTKIIRANFSEAMNPATINALTFTLFNGVTNVPGIVTYSGVTASFAPSANLMTNTTYTATITTGAKDLGGNAIASNYIWTFTTGATIGQATINLGSAGNFAILAGAGVTNTGLTIVTGDLGTSPTGTVTGFPPGIVNGTIHAANPTAAQAKLDLTAAFNDAQGRVLNMIVLPGNISGLTLTPGLYKNATSVMLTAGSVTLDAQGDSNAIFIFQMGSTLTTSPGTTVILSGGAQAKNIFWAVGTSATLGTNSTFYGNILADQSISLNTGAILYGRALTRIAAVTLQSNIVTKPQ